jgi:hypothetical protein
MSDSDLWTYRSSEETPDVTGFDVEAVDGHAGKVDDDSYDLGSSALVVDTGWWIFGKKRIVPTETIQTIDLEQRRIFLRMTKEQVKAARSMASYYNRW